MLIRPVLSSTMLIRPVPSSTMLIRPVLSSTMLIRPVLSSTMLIRPVLSSTMPIRPVLRLCQIRTLTKSIRVTAVSKSFQLKEVIVDGVQRERKPLVLLFDWLYAKPAHLEKYCSLYHDIGLDVLTIHGKLSHFLWPPKAMKLSEDLMKYLLETRRGEDQLFVHAFSVGAYNYTINMQKSLEDHDKFGQFRSMVCGQVFDSIVIGSYENMSTGIAEVLSPKTRTPVVKLMDIYYHFTHKTTKDTYDKLVSNFKTKPICVPTVVFYSHNDPMCNVPTIQALEQTWKRDFPEFDVVFKSWEKSTHAAHLKEHPDEYMDVWKNLVSKCDLIR